MGIISHIPWIRNSGFMYRGRLSVFRERNIINNNSIKNDYAILHRIQYLVGERNMNRQKYFITVIGTILISIGLHTTLKGEKQNALHHNLSVNLNKYLGTHYKHPFDYVVDKFKDHDLVIIGEYHHIQQYVCFIDQLIPRLYSEAGVRFIGCEFFASSCQKDIDKLVNGDEYDNALETQIIRESAVNAGFMWPYEEYIEVFKTVWKLNKNITEKSERFSIIFMAPDINWHNIHYGNEEEKKTAMLQFMEADKLYADPIIKEFDNNHHKGLVWCGATHAVTRLKGNPKRGPEIRCGGYLYKQYRDKVFHIELHGFWYYRGRDESYALNGLLDKVLNEHNKPIGFDLIGSPFATLELPTDFIWAVNNPSAKFRDYCDGYIWLLPLEKFEGNHIMNIDKIVPDDEAFHKVIRNAHSKSAQELNLSRDEFIALWRKQADEFEHFQLSFMPFLLDHDKNIP